MPKSLLGEIDNRAAALGLSRSQYLTQLARQDLADKGELVLRETPLPYSVSSTEKQIGEHVGKEVRKHTPSKKSK